MNTTRKIFQIMVTSIALMAMLLSTAQPYSAHALGQNEVSQTTEIRGGEARSLPGMSAYHVVGMDIREERAMPAVITGTVTIWHSYEPGSPDETAFIQVIQNAETANPSLDIVTEFHSYGDIINDYRAAVKSGGGPDMYITTSDEIGTLAREGLILNLDNDLQGKLTNVIQNAIDGMKVNGHLYGVPQYAKAVGLYYNKSMVPTPPTTTAELLALLQGGETLAT